MSGRTVPLTIQVVPPERFSIVPPVTMSDYEDVVDISITSRRCDPEHTIMAHMQFSDNGVLVVEFKEAFNE